MNPHSILVMALAGTFAAPAILAQTCNPNIRSSAPNDRYVVNEQESTVLDQQTGLTWKRCVEGQTGNDCGTGSPTLLNWGGALRLASASTFAGYKDWRVPNRKELESLVEVACYGPAINATVFQNDPGTWVGASSPNADGSATAAWNVHFGGGFSSYYYRGHYTAVRLVRGGQ